MNKLITRNIIRPKASLPFNVVKGNVTQRNAKMSECWNKFVDEFVKTETPTVEEYRNCINKALEPYKISYRIFEEDNPECAGGIAAETRQEYRGKNKMDIIHLSYNLWLPIDKDGKIESKQTAVHETTHLFDYLFNPKIALQRLHYSINKPECDKDVLNLKDSVLDTILDNFKKEDADKALSKLPNDVAIETLQHIRHSLQTEKKAYYSEFKYFVKKGPVKNIKDRKSVV